MVKRICLFSILFSISTFSFSQTWIDSGAEWHYLYNGFMDAGFYKVNYVGDTTIDGKICQKLEQSKYRFSTDQYNQWYYLGVDTLNPEFTYLSGDTVFRYKNNRFNILYNFGAQPGDTWDLGIDTNQWLCSQSVIEVDSISSIVRNGITLRCLFVSPHENSSEYFWGWINEKFGATWGYLFPMENNCDPYLAVEFDQIGFSCYKDDSFPLINYTNVDCEYFWELVNIPALTIDKITISPNPIIDKFTVNISGSSTIENIRIFNLQGELKGDYNNPVININDFQSGLYILEIKLSDGKFLREKIIKT